MAVKKNKKFYIGIDIGATNIKAVLFDGAKVLSDSVLATPDDNIEHLLIMVKAAAEPLLEEAKKRAGDIESFGVGIAGILDASGQIVISSCNIPVLANVRLAEKLKDYLGQNIKLANDADCFVLAETRLGAGVGHKSVYGITIGTGIGGGWCLDGKIFSGSHGSASEVGHLVLNGVKGDDLEENYKKLINNNPAKLARDAYLGQGPAERAFEDLGKELGLAIANIANTIDPEIFIIGGGVAQASELFMKEIKEQAKEYIVNPRSNKELKIVRAKLGLNSGAIGAALL